MLLGHLTSRTPSSPDVGLRTKRSGDAAKNGISAFTTSPHFITSRSGCNVAYCSTAFPSFARPNARAGKVDGGFL